MVAATSISVRTPKPSASSALRARATASSNGSGERARRATDGAAGTVMRSSFSRTGVRIGARRAPGSPSREAAGARSARAPAAVRGRVAAGCETRDELLDLLAPALGARHSEVVEAGGDEL